MLPNLAYLALLTSGLLILAHIHTTHHLQRLMHQHLYPNHPPNSTSFDFIVVGSGSSGSVVAARLAEAGHSVLLIEAGGPAHFLQGVPKFGPFFIGTPYDWQYRTKPDDNDNFAAYRDRSLSYTRGKVLGGSSMLNFMMYMRGHSADFDEWELMGNPGWSYRHLLPLFKRSERFVGRVKDGDLFHGFKGRMGVQPSPHTSPVDDVIRVALKELGYHMGDVNGADEDEGFMEENQATLENGWRVGAFGSFVQPLLADARYRIEVLPYSQATKLLFERLKVVGVEVERFGEKLRYLAGNEVVVSAGAIGSPQLLMLSGIGPRKHLEEVGIDVVADLEGVGSNLQDHVLTQQYFVLPKKAGLLSSPFAHLNPLNYLTFLASGSGPLSDNGCGVSGYFHSPVNNDTTRPDLQLLTSPFGMDADLGLGMKEAYAIEGAGFEARYRAVIDGGELETVNILPALLRPKSRGTVRLQSKDFNDAPIVDPNYLSHPSDLRTMVEGVKFVHSLQETEVFKRHGLRSAPPDAVYCADHEAYSDAYWQCFVRAWSTTVWHASGTCRMGPEGDEGAVVDARLRVRGVRGLRVADASVMPRLVGANTAAACGVIGERAAEAIVEDWRGIGEETADKGVGMRDEL